MALVRCAENAGTWPRSASVAGVAGVSGLGVRSVWWPVIRPRRERAWRRSRRPLATKPRQEARQGGRSVKKVSCDADELIAALVRANAEGGGRLELEPKCTYTLTAFGEDENGSAVVSRRSSSGSASRVTARPSSERPTPSRSASSMSVRRRPDSARPDGQGRRRPDEWVAARCWSRRVAGPPSRTARSRSTGPTSRRCHHQPRCHQDQRAKDVRRRTTRRRTATARTATVRQGRARRTTTQMRRAHEQHRRGRRRWGLQRPGRLTVEGSRMSS